MSADTLALGDRLRRLIELGTIFDNLRDRFNLSEIPEAFSAFSHAADLTGSSDLGDAAQLGIVVDAWLDFAREGADVTKTEADDSFVETLGKVRANFDWLINIVAGMLKARTEGLATAMSEATISEAQTLGFDPMTLLALVNAIVDFIIRFRKK